MVTIEGIPSTLLGPMWACACVLARLGPALIMMPPVQGVAIPMRVKSMLGIMIAASMAPLVWSQSTGVPSQGLEIVLALVRESLLGFLIGTSVLIVITSLQLGSHLLGTLSHLDFAQAHDPATDESVPILQQLMSLLAVALFLLMGGHRMLIGVCLDSFMVYPAGAVRMESHWWVYLVDLVGHGMSFGLRASAPATLALLLAHLITGLLARSLPPLNWIAIGFPIQSATMLLVLSMSLAGIGWVFQAEVSEWMESTTGLLEGRSVEADSHLEASQPKAIRDAVLLESGWIEAARQDSLNGQWNSQPAWDGPQRNREGQGG
jgi:flagellar biosynthesis protein FliR